MASSNQFRISTNGSVLEGFESDQVAVEFSKMFGVSPDKAADFVNNKKLVKQGLSQKQVDLFESKLNSIGVAVTVKAVASNDDQFSLAVVQPKAEPVKSAAPEAAIPASAVQTEGATVIPPATVQKKSLEAHRMECPKCQHEQDKGFDECKSCGFTLASSNDTEEDDEEEIFTSVGLIFPAAAAALGAFVWMAIAIGIGWEFGFIAWAIGGAIGFASTMTSCKGNKIGAYCAILAILSIMGGKYFTALSVKDDLVAEGSLASEWQEYEAEYRLDASEFSSVSRNETSIKTFMVDRGYTNADNAKDVDQYELDEFVETTQPFLEDVHTLGADFGPTDFEAAWNGGESVSDMSTWDIMWYSTGWMSLLFLLLGVSTAFKMAREGGNN